MMFSDEEIKEIPESTFMRPGDEIISIQEVCLGERFDRKDSGFHVDSLLPNPGKNELDAHPSIYSDGLLESLEREQARFAWTEEDGNIASLVSEPGFGTTGQTTFGNDLDAALISDIKEVDIITSSSASSVYHTSKNGWTFMRKTVPETQVSSTSSSTSAVTPDRPSKTPQNSCKVDKSDPRSKVHYVKYLKRQGRNIKLWECGICGREFQHQYTLMRHLPTHTDERNFHCNACGKSFRQLSTLSQHKAIHSTERPYSCEVCNKTFNRVSTLISHRKTHSDQKPYRCHICPKGFHQKGNLRNHLFTHTNERPYRCNICYKGFNQQSNLVCHKNKAHPEDGSGGAVPSVCKRALPRIVRPPPENKPDSTKQVNYNEVSSSVGPYLSSMGESSSSDWRVKTEFIDLTSENDHRWTSMTTSGVIVDPIKTYHMGVALAQKQTPFALLKPDNGTPVLVKVIDTKLPSGKQMLVPATAEDLRIGGKIIVNNDGTSALENKDSLKLANSNKAVQIRVPVVATVIPQMKPGGRLSLCVEEPRHLYHTALSAHGEVSVEPCSLRASSPIDLTRRFHLPQANRSNNSFDVSGTFPEVSCESIRSNSNNSCDPPDVTRRFELPSCFNFDRPGGSASSSPPLDLISLDLFEPMDCIPLGPQITAVDHIDNPPPSDESDIFIRDFEESIPLSDSD